MHILWHEWAYPAPQLKTELSAFFSRSLSRPAKGWIRSSARNWLFIQVAVALFSCFYACQLGER